MEIVVPWLLLAILIGYWAGQKGRSGVGWFILAVLISPLIAGLFLLVTSSKAPGAPRVSGWDANWQPKPKRASAWGYPEKTVAQPPPPPDHLALLNSLSELRDRGVLSEDEFAAKKAEVLSRV